MRVVNTSPKDDVHSPDSGLFPSLLILNGLGYLTRNAPPIPQLDPESKGNPGNYQHRTPKYRSLGP
jgi:hypothetical protein